MQISNHIFTQRMQFKAVTAAGEMIRTVYIYLVTGDNVSYLVDTGVYPNAEDVLAFITECGKKWEDVRGILITHAHVDHVGALKYLKQRLGCPAAASALSTPWIEDAARQFRERPVPNFQEFMGGSAQIDKTLHAGDSIDLGGSTLTVYAAPGHEKGQLAFFHEEDGVLISADSIPVPGEIPIYEDVSAQLDTIRRLYAIKGVKILLMSWDIPHEDDQAIKKVFFDAFSYVRRVHQLTLEGISRYGDADSERIAKYVHTALGLPSSTYTKLFTGTIDAHIREKNLSIGNLEE